MKAKNEKNGRSLLGIEKIRQIRIDCPEIAWAREVHIRANKTLLVCENIAAHPSTTYVLDASDQRFEIFMNPEASNTVLAKELKI